MLLSKSHSQHRHSSNYSAKCLQTIHHPSCQLMLTVRTCYRKLESELHDCVSSSDISVRTRANVRLKLTQVLPLIAEVQLQVHYFDINASQLVNCREGGSRGFEVPVVGPLCSRPSGNDRGVLRLARIASTLVRLEAGRT